MDINYFLNKSVVLELRDSSKIKGIIVEIKEEIDDDGEELKLILRINSDDYRIIYVNEIENIGEII